MLHNTMGSGGGEGCVCVKFTDKKHYNGVLFNVISVMEGVGVKFS